MHAFGLSAVARDSTVFHEVTVLTGMNQFIYWRTVFACIQLQSAAGFFIGKFYRQF